MHHLLFLKCRALVNGLLRNLEILRCQFRRRSPTQPLEALYANLLCSNRVNVCDEDACTSSTHRKSGALADIAVATVQHTLAANYHICCAPDLGCGVEAS